MRRAFGLALALGVMIACSSFGTESTSSEDAGATDATGPSDAPFGDTSNDGDDDNCTTLVFGDGFDDRDNASLQGSWSGVTKPADGIAVTIGDDGNGSLHALTVAIQERDAGISRSAVYLEKSIADLRKCRELELSLYVQTFPLGGNLVLASIELENTTGALLIELAGANNLQISEQATNPPSTEPLMTLPISGQSWTSVRLRLEGTSVRVNVGIGERTALRKTTSTRPSAVRVGAVVPKRWASTYRIDGVIVR
jgi:hypothetical protein